MSTKRECETPKTKEDFFREESVDIEELIGRLYRGGENPGFDPQAYKHPQYTHAGLAERKDTLRMLIEMSCFEIDTTNKDYHNMASDPKNNPYDNDDGYS